MNREKNLRYQETDEKIKAVFRELLKTRQPEKITVTDICREAGINRSSFYLHYLDLDELENSMAHDLEGRLYDILMKVFHDPLRIDVYITEYFQLIRESQELLALVGYRLPHDPQIAKGFYKLGMELGVLDKTELEYHGSFFLGGLESLASAWVRGGCKEEPEYLMKIIDDEYHNFSQTFKFKV